MWGQLLTPIVAGLVAGLTAWLVTNRQLRARRDDQILDLAATVIASARRVWLASYDLEYVIQEMVRDDGFPHADPEREAARVETRRINEVRRVEGIGERYKAREAGLQAAALLGLRVRSLERPARDALDSAGSYSHETRTADTLKYQQAVQAFSDDVRAYVKAND